MEREIAMKRAASFCAESERSVAEVERRLRKWGVDDDEYTEVLRKLIDDKLRTIKDTDVYSAKVKILGYALRRGFESDIVSKILKDVF